MLDRSIPEPPTHTFPISTIHGRRETADVRDGDRGAARPTTLRTDEVCNLDHAIRSIERDDRTRSTLLAREDLPEVEEVFGRRDALREERTILPRVSDQQCDVKTERTYVQV